MAVILVLVCSALGFGSAVTALVLFDASLLQAFALWMSGGFMAMLLAVLPVLLPRPEPQEVRQAERA